MPVFVVAAQSALRIKTLKCANDCIKKHRNGDIVSVFLIKPIGQIRIFLPR